jgi:peptide/nickel transport system ATP-binding protein
MKPAREILSRRRGLSVDFEDKEVLLSLRAVEKTYRLKGKGLLGGGVREVTAVDDVDLDIYKGEVLALVGESGSGKSTMGKVICMLEPISRGSVRFDGVELGSLRGEERRRMRKRIQMVFQDPYESLNPRFTTYQTLSEPLREHKVVATEDAVRERVYAALERVELRPPETFVDRYPFELSGGQRQRVAVARAIILEPDFVIADEPVSMMDASVRVGVLNTMLSLKSSMSMTFLFVTHDLSVARYMADRIAIMYLGQMLEIGATDRVIQDPVHPYSRALISAVPSIDPSVRRERVTIPGEIPNPTQKPPGCYFHTRCPHAEDVCKQKTPSMKEAPNGSMYRCHREALSLGTLR